MNFCSVFGSSAIDSKEFDVDESNAQCLTIKTVHLFLQLIQCMLTFLNEK